MMVAVASRKEGHRARGGGGGARYKRRPLKVKYGNRATAVMQLTV